MRKYPFCLLVMFVALACSQNLLSQPLLQADRSLCPALYEYTPSGCWTSCKNPKYNQCPDMYPLYYNPSFCAYTKDGLYANYTFECQACKSTQIVAVRDGACSCDFLKCGPNQICEYGQCVDVEVYDPCQSVQCQPGHVCQNGQCVVSIPVPKPCTMLCMIGYVCQNGQCVPNNCATVQCLTGTVCRNGQCIPIDKCATVKCSEGHVCRNGQCVVDNIDWDCLGVYCIATTRCVAGRCVPLEGNLNAV